MATYYVKSTATGTGDGSSWVNAFTSLSGYVSVGAAGDVVYISSNHVETVEYTAALSGTLSNPVQILCVDDAAIPPTTKATGALLKTSSITGVASICGCTFEANTPNFGGDKSSLNFDTCRFRGRSTANAQFAISFGSLTANQECRVSAKNCTFSGNSSGATSGFCRVSQCRLEIIGGGVEADHKGVLLFSLSGLGQDTNISGFDFSLANPTRNLFQIIESVGRVVAKNCRLQDAWTGSLSSAIANPSTLIEMYNCDNADTNYRLWIEDITGTVKHETTRVRTGGASDGVTPIAWAMSTTASSAYPVATLATPEIVVWNDTTGAAKTVTVEVLTDGVTLKDDECWLEVQYLGTSGFPLSSFITDAKADVLATAVDQTTSTETWTTTGLTTPVKQKLSVTFTPQEKGFVHAKVMLAKPSTTVYVCPKASVT